MPLMDISSSMTFNERASWNKLIILMLYFLAKNKYFSNTFSNYILNLKIIVIINIINNLINIFIINNLISNYYNK